MDVPDLLALGDGFKTSRILQAACELEFFDHTRKPAGRADLAEALDASERGVRILCDALASLELLEKDEEGRWVNRPVAETYLVTDAPDTLAHMIRFHGMNWGTWDRLEAAVRTGEPQREDTMFQEDAEATERFMRAMVSIGRARGDAEVLPERVDLSDRRLLVDVGGGPGHFTRGFLKAHPTLEAAVLDLPATLDVTSELVDAWGPERERLMLIEGDYIDDPIPACDAVLLSNILHGEPPARCQALLENIAEGMMTGGKLVIKEHILAPDRTSPEVAARFAVDMLLMTGGDCYTLDQVTGWLEEAGFEDVEEQPPEAPLTSSIVTATKA